jgi:hypothetical protein
MALFTTSPCTVPILFDLCLMVMTHMCVRQMDNLFLSVEGNFLCQIEVGHDFILPDDYIDLRGCHGSYTSCGYGIPFFYGYSLIQFMLFFNMPWYPIS